MERQLFASCFVWRPFKETPKLLGYQTECIHSFKSPEFNGGAENALGKELPFFVLHRQMRPILTPCPGQQALDAPSPKQPCVLSGALSGSGPGTLSPHVPRGPVTARLH